MCGITITDDTQHCDLTSYDIMKKSPRLRSSFCYYFALYAPLIFTTYLPYFGHHIPPFSPIQPFRHSSSSDRGLISSFAIMRYETRGATVSSLTPLPHSLLLHRGGPETGLGGYASNQSASRRSPLRFLQILDPFNHTMHLALAFIFLLLLSSYNSIYPQLRFG